MALFGLIWILAVLFLYLRAVLVYMSAQSHTYTYTRGFLPSAPPGDCLVSRTTERYKTIRSFFTYSFILLCSIFNFLFLDDK